MSSRFATACVATLLLAACGGGDSGTAPVVTPPPPPSNPDVDGDGFLNAVDACPNQAEVINNVFDSDGCPDVPLDLYIHVFDDVQAFWEITLEGVVVYSHVEALEGYTTSIASPCGDLGINNAAYCPVSASVFYDSNFFERLLADVGGVAPAFIIAHEIGHHVSNLLGWLSDPRLSRKDLELQADCFGGVWARSANDRRLLEERDLDEAIISLFSTGSPDETWFDPAIHGTDVERAWAFGVGWQGGGARCTSEAFIQALPTTTALTH